MWSINIVTYRKELVCANFEVVFLDLMAIWIENQESKGVTAVTDLSCFLEIKKQDKISSPKASNGQRFPGPALLSPWFSWGEAGQQPR